MIQFICFSRKRPLQLHGYLKSLFHNIPDQVAVGVVLKTDPEYANAYSEVKNQFPYVYFVEETNFKENIQGLLDRSAADYVSFGCDDVCYTGVINPTDIDEAFRSEPILGLSLRLGRNVINGMFGEAMPLPRFRPSPTRKLVWDVSDPGSVGDWCYPFEVLGTCYPKRFVHDIVGAIDFENPSQLEAYGSAIWHLATQHRLMASYPTARYIVPTINLVQTEYPGNGFLGSQALSPEFLLECWNNGLRMDFKAFENKAHSSWRVPDFYLKRV